jgi:hypothetical protein
VAPQFLTREEKLKNINKKVEDVSNHENIAIRYIEKLDKGEMTPEIMGDVKKFMDRKLIPATSNLAINLHEYLFDFFLSIEEFGEAMIYGELAVNGGDSNNYNDVLHGLTTMKMGKLLIWQKIYQQGNEYLDKAAKILQYSHGFKDSVVFQEFLDLKAEANAMLHR